MPVVLVFLAVLAGWSQGPLGKYPAHAKSSNGLRLLGYDGGGGERFQFLVRFNVGSNQEEGQEERVISVVMMSPLSSARRGLLGGDPGVVGEAGSPGYSTISTTMPFSKRSPASR